MPSCRIPSIRRSRELQPRKFRVSFRFSLNWCRAIVVLRFVPSLPATRHQSEICTTDARRENFQPFFIIAIPVLIDPGEQHHEKHNEKNQTQFVEFALEPTPESHGAPR